MQTTIEDQRTEIWSPSLFHVVTGSLIRRFLRDAKKGGSPLEQPEPPLSPDRRKTIARLRRCLHAVGRRGKNKAPLHRFLLQNL